MSKNTSVVISKDKIFLWNTNQIKFEEVCVWTSKTLLEQLKILKQKNSLSKVQVFLSDDISFVLSFVMEPIKDSNERHEKISSKIAERIPEYFENIVWDYKIIDYNDKVIVQVAAIEHELITQIQSNFAEAKIEVSMIEPLSCALAKNIKSSDNSKIVLFTSTIESILFFVYKSSVFVVDVIDSNQIANEIKRFIEYTNEKYSSFRADVFIVSDGQKIAPVDIETILKDYGIQTQTKKDALMELSGVGSIEQSHKNSERLDLIESDALAKPSLMFNLKAKFAKILLSYKHHKNEKRSKIFMTVFILCLLLTSVIYVFNYLNKNTEKDISTNIIQNEEFINPNLDMSNQEDLVKNEEDAETIDAVSTIDELKLADFSGYKLQILNGSGIRGEADKLRLLLTDLKFTEIAIGNADKTNYEDTIVSYKTMKLLNNTELFDTRMVTYKMEHAERLLDENNPFDIVIIVGKARLDNKGNNIENETEASSESVDSSGIAPIQ